jgi:hypothetical protein
MTRKVTITYELPEDLCHVLEQKAAIEGRRLEDVVAEHLAFQRRPSRQLSPQEAAKRQAAFEQHIGAWDSGRADSSDNEGIDADLASEYAARRERGA